jgi:hypothetical protein
MTLDTAQLRSKLKLKHLSSESVLQAHHPSTVKLLESSGIKPGKLRSHAQKLLTSTVLAGSLLLAPGQSLSTQAALPQAAITKTISAEDMRLKIMDEMDVILPKDSSWKLNSQQEAQVSDILHSTFGIHASAELEGNKLNNSYGLIGAEQHLPRFPGDTAQNHGQFVNSGITPGRGAWGYFAYSRAELTPDLVEKERYYVAVQTLYLPDWSTRLAYLRDWYKYRKVVVTNPSNGRTIVAVIADAGPAAWTGKHFGGSPEVMAYLGLNVGKQKGAVTLFFVDDPQDKVPLGPLEYNLENPLRLPA